MKKTYFLFPIIIFSSFQFSVYAQTISVSDTFSVNKNNLYKISSLNIIPFTENIFVSQKLLQKNQYKISYEQGVFSLNDNFAISPFDTIVITYKSLLINLSKEYKKRNLTSVYDTLSQDSIKIIKPLKTILSSESIFGKNMQKSGAIIRGFTFGTNQDFTLNSGLRLQLSGKLSDDIELTAALTDENIPIQPEGNTETLQELDKVFIELKHKNTSGVFGDFDFVDKQSEFSKLTKKLQGLSGKYISKRTGVNFVIANSRGKFNSIQFYGKDGNQGPYKLYGINNERSIIIIAGSERVYIDGEIMKRGENNDYTIDYSNAEVTFTPKRLITSLSRITIDFEYTDLNYKRNFLGANFISTVLNNKVSFGLSYYREGDDEKNPFELSLSDNDIQILKNAGDNRNNASRSGVSLVIPDSNGKTRGYYSKIDTVINYKAFSYYKYLPGTESSIYNVEFTYVGENKGDYIKESLGNYKFVGIGNGNYLPIVFLPFPELKQVGNLFMNAALWEGTNFRIELSGSSWDKNLFSKIDDNDNLGYARKITLQIEPKEVFIKNISLGKFGISFNDRYIQSRYTTVDRINEVEFNRYYNISSMQNQNQTLREIGITYQPVSKMNIFSQYGLLKQGVNFFSNRYLNEIKFTDNQVYTFYYKLDYVNSKNESIRSNWNRQSFSSFYSFGFLKPSFNFLYENKEDKLNDTLTSTSLKYSELIPSFEVGSNAINLRASYSLRDEYLPLNNEMKKLSKANTFQIQLDYSKIKSFTTSLSFALREKKFTDEFEKKGYVNNETILLLSQSRFNLFNNFLTGDLYYQAATEQTARTEKVFMRVPKGRGNYIYLGDLNNNGLTEENEFQLTSYNGDYILVNVPTEQLFPVIDLKSYLRYRIDFDKIIKEKNFILNVIKNISMETNLKIDENSKEQNIKEIYLLHFSKFLNDSTTIRGSQLFQQDLNFFRNNQAFSVRLRFLQRRNLNQFSSGIEKGFFKERSIRVKFRIAEEVNNQTDFVNQIDNLLAPTFSNRARMIIKNELSTDFSFRPENKLEFGFKILTGENKDYHPAKPVIVNVNSQLIRINYSVANFGRFRIELERTELVSNYMANNIPFEITRGNVIGKNYFCRAYFDYKIGSNIQTSVNYDARIYGKGKIIQTMRAEARAFF